MIKIFFSFFLIHVFIYAADPPFKTGEILKYTADWNGIKVGEAELFVSGIEKINGFDSYKISFTTKTKGLANRVFPIQDKIDVWIDKKNYFTHRLKKDINQANHKEQIDVTFNYEKFTAKSKDKEIHIDFEARGPYSMFYYLRTFEIKQNKIMMFTSYEGKKIVNYNLKMSGTEMINSDLGTYSCKVIRPFQKGKELFKNKGDMRIWISETKKRLPVKIQMKIQYGSITLLLKEIN
jgi:hypothetical protein